MKNQNIIYHKLCIMILFLSSFLLQANTTVWGPTGHRAVAELAQQHLKRKTKRKLKKLLGVQYLSLAKYATYADDIKSDPKSRKYNAWHYINLEPADTYDPKTHGMQKNIITAIEKCILVLEDKKATTPDREFHLKMLIHLIADLHQPLHVGRKKDKGGNTIQLRFFNKGTNLHSLWDSKMIEQYNMSYTELAANLILDKKQIKKLQKGDVLHWLTESQALATQVYASAKQKDKLYYPYMYAHFSTLSLQLQKAAIRLAKILNTIYA